MYPFKSSERVYFHWSYILPPYSSLFHTISLLICYISPSLTPHSIGLYGIYLLLILLSHYFYYSSSLPSSLNQVISRLQTVCESYSLPVDGGAMKALQQLVDGLQTAYNTQVGWDWCKMTNSFHIWRWNYPLNLFTIFYQYPYCVVNQLQVAQSKAAASEQVRTPH